MELSSLIQIQKVSKHKANQPRRAMVVRVKVQLLRFFITVPEGQIKFKVLKFLNSKNSENLL